MRLTGGGAGSGYCRSNPQYRCAPLSQQPVWRQTDCRAWQLLTQDEGLRGSLVFAQMTMQAFSSSLQCSGAAFASPLVIKSGTKAAATRCRSRIILPDNTTAAAVCTRRTV